MWLPYSLPCGSHIGSHIHSHVAAILAPILAPMWLPYWLHTFVLLIAYVCFWIYHDICCHMLMSICSSIYIHYGQRILPANWEFIGSLLGACWELVASVLGACWELVGRLLGACCQRVGSLYTPKVAPIWCNVSYADIYRYSFIVIHSHIGSILAPYWLSY